MGNGVQTKCINCGRVLTDGKGVRVLSGNFDPDLPNPGVDDGGDTTWARCDVCLETAHSARIGLRVTKGENVAPHEGGHMSLEDVLAEGNRQAHSQDGSHVVLDGYEWAILLESIKEVPAKK